MLSNLDKMIARVLYSFEACNTSDILNCSNFSLAKMTYFCNNGSLVLGFYLKLWDYKLGIYPQTNAFCSHLGGQCETEINRLIPNLVIGDGKLKI